MNSDPHYYQRPTGVYDEPSPSEVRRFQLVDSLVAAGDSAARVRWGSGTDWIPDEDEDSDDTVFDSVFNDDTGEASGMEGTQGWAIYCPDLGQWRVLKINCA